MARPYVIVGCLAVQAHLTATSALPPVLANGVGRRSGEFARGAPLMCALIRKNFGHAGSVATSAFNSAGRRTALSASDAASVTATRCRHRLERHNDRSPCSFVAFLMGKVFIMTLVLVRSCLHCGESRRERDSHGLLFVIRGLCAARPRSRRARVFTKG